MSKNKIPARTLLQTERGKSWLAQFGEADQETAQKILTSLTLVSHSEFERGIQAELESVALGCDTPIAFFSVREVKQKQSYFDAYTDKTTGKINALDKGNDLGSEARIVTAIRNYCKTNPARLLNHPSLAEMRSAKCRTILLVDDFIGSGKRMIKFIESFWADRTFVSWHSLKYVKIVVLAYSGTERGVHVVSRHKAKPEVLIVRDCPTYNDMPWGKELRKSVLEVCKRYGRRTSWARSWDGYGHALAALVFEHGCPNNAPAILWAPPKGNKRWSPLFPDRSILAIEKSAFPPEIARGDLLNTLMDVGQKKLAVSGQLSRRGELGALILIILALISKGQRRQSTLGYATGLTRKACREIVDRCVKWKFLTPSIRLTERGHAELAVARQTGRVYGGRLDRGDSHYFPKQLRRAARG